MEDFDLDSALDCPPLDDYAFSFTADVKPFDLDHILDGVDDFRRCGRGKDMEKLRRCLLLKPPDSDDDDSSESESDGDELKTTTATTSPSPSSSDLHRPNSSTTDGGYRRPNWDDEARLEASKRKLRQGYEETQRKRPRIQVIDIKSLPVPKPQRGRGGGRVFNNKTMTNTFNFKSRRCLAF